MINKISINGIYYNVEDGVAYTDKATEELDTITFNIFNTKPIPIKAYQEVVVYFTNPTRIKTFLVNTWIDEVATYNGLKNYTISCISETKKLERVQLPTTTITQPLGLKENEKRKYDKYINQTMEYVNKVYPELIVNDDLLEKMSKVVAVEEQFNAPNAKEYLNSILGKVSSIVSVNNGYINYLDLTKKNNPIDESKILFTNTTETLEDYYTDIITDVQGVQSEEATIFTEFVGVRSPENAVLTYDNAVIKLSHNINYLKEVIMWAKINIENEHKLKRYRIYGDNRKLIKEKSEYDLLKVSNKVTDIDAELKRTNLYYTRGSNTIEGLAYTEKTWFVGMQSVLPAIENIIALINKENGVLGIFDGDIRDLKFEITYSALDDVSTRFEKDAGVKSIVKDNQTDSYVDLDKFAKAQQEKINRLGNSVMEINARYFTENDIPQLMDYIDDYILAEREIVYHNGYIDFKGVLYKDYVKKNLFYGVNAKRRNYNLMLGNEAVTRKEVTKEVYQFDFVDKDINKDTARYILGKIVASNYKGTGVANDQIRGLWYFKDIYDGYRRVIPSNEDFDINLEFWVVDTDSALTYKATKMTLYFEEYEDDNGFVVANDLLYFTIDGVKTLVYDGTNWINGNKYKIIDIDTFDSEVFDNNNIITTQEFYDNFLTYNANLKTDVSNPNDNYDEQYNYTEKDFLPIQLVKCTSNFADGTSTTYKLEPDVRKANNSVTINLKWYDNINVGMKIDGIKDSSIIDTINNSKGGYEQQYVTYTDENGELESITLQMYDVNITTERELLYDAIDSFPSLASDVGKENNMLFNKTLSRYKDNREILNETIQIEVVGNDNIFVNDRFINMTPFFKKYKQWLYVWISTDEKYDKYNCDKVVDSATMMSGNLEIDYSDFLNFYDKNNAFNRVLLYNNNVDLTNVKSWAIADGNGNVYIAVNKRDEDDVIATMIYLNKKGD